MENGTFIIIFLKSLIDFVSINYLQLIQ